MPFWMKTSSPRVLLPLPRGRGMHCPAQSSWHSEQEELGENSWRRVVVLGHAGFWQQV